MNEAYQPISCVNHERLEYVALKGEWLEVEVMQGEHAGRRLLLPLDVYACDGMEWMKAQTESGEKITIRLDHFRF